MKSSGCGPHDKIDARVEQGRHVGTASVRRVSTQREGDYL